MTWFWVIGLAVAAFAALAWGLKAPRKGWEAIGAALVVGLAGFALQASPGQPGAPKDAVRGKDDGGAMLVTERQALAQLVSPSTAQPDRWLLTADAMTRNGNYSDAATMLLGGVEENPRNTEAWVALGNNLVAHADGVLTPAALHAFRKGAEADPASPLPSYFLGLALVRGGQFAEGRALWADLLARSPAGAPWREGLAAMVTRLDAMIAEQDKQSQ